MLHIHKGPAPGLKHNAAKGAPPRTTDRPTDDRVVVGHRRECCCYRSQQCCSPGRKRVDEDGPRGKLEQISKLCSFHNLFHALIAGYKRHPPVGGTEMSRRVGTKLHLSLKNSWPGFIALNRSRRWRRRDGVGVRPRAVQGAAQSFPRQAHEEWIVVLRCARLKQTGGGGCRWERSQRMRITLHSTKMEIRKRKGRIVDEGKIFFLGRTQSSHGRRR